MTFGPTGFGNIGQAMTQPVATPTGTGSSADMSKWQMFRNRLANDPNLRMALLTAGLNMMRTPQEGQSSFDVFSNAALTGVGTLDELRQRQRTQGIEDEDRVFERETTERKLGMDERRTGAMEEGLDIRRTEANTRAAQGAQRNALLTRQLDIAERELELQEGGGATGPERMRNAAIADLVTSGRFENTPEGRAQAANLVDGLSGDLSPEAQLRVALGYVESLRKTNEKRILFGEGEPWTEAEMMEMAYNDVQALSERFRGKFGAPSSEYKTGDTVTHPSRGVAIITALDNGRYTLTFINPETGEKEVSNEVGIDTIRKLENAAGN